MIREYDLIEASYVPEAFLKLDDDVVSKIWSADTSPEAGQFRDIMARFYKRDLYKRLKPAFWKGDGVKKYYDKNGRQQVRRLGIISND